MPWAATAPRWPAASRAAIVRRARRLALSAGGAAVVASGPLLDRRRAYGPIGQRSRRGIASGQRELDHARRGDEPHRAADLPPPPGDRLQRRMGDEAEANAGGDGEGEGHGQRGDDGRHAVRGVVPIRPRAAPAPSGRRRTPMPAPWRSQGWPWRAARGAASVRNSRATTTAVRPVRPPACGALDVAHGRRGAEDGAEDGASGIRLQRSAEVRHVAVAHAASSGVIHHGPGVAPPTFVTVRTACSAPGTGHGKRGWKGRSHRWPRLTSGR
jgi:hypothetical protein